MSGRNAGRKNTTYIVDQTLAATFNGPDIDCRGYKKLTIEVRIDSANDAVVTLAVQAAGGAYGLWGAVTLEKMQTSDTTAITLASGAVSVNDPAADAAFTVVIENPAPLMRLACTSRTAGGAADLDAAYWLDPA